MIGATIITTAIANPKNMIRNIIFFLRKSCGNSKAAAYTRAARRAAQSGDAGGATDFVEYTPDLPQKRALARPSARKGRKQVTWTIFMGCPESNPRSGILAAPVRYRSVNP